MWDHKEDANGMKRMLGWTWASHVTVLMLWMFACLQGRNLAAADSDVEEPSEVEEEQEFPTVGSGSESSTYGLTKKKKRRPKERKEKSPRRKRDDDDEDDDQDEDGAMKVSAGRQSACRESRYLHPAAAAAMTTMMMKWDLKG